MEVVLLLVAIVGVALIVVPRLRGRRAGAASRRRPRAQARGWRRGPPAATPVAAPGLRRRLASEEDVWDDDLGWEGQDAAPADARRVEPAGAMSRVPVRPSPAAELPSVERWRERAASGDDWLEDDDGLGWEGTA